MSARCNCETQEFVRRGRRRPPFRLAQRREKSSSQAVDARKQGGIGGLTTRRPSLSDAQRRSPSSNVDLSHPIIKQRGKPTFESTPTSKRSRRRGLCADERCYLLARSTASM
ncbi:hypothetical protein BJY59DRAFT_186886 [Rhodotorula toruloides]